MPTKDRRSSGDRDKNPNLRYRWKYIKSFKICSLQNNLQHRDHLLPEDLPQGSADTEGQENKENKSHCAYTITKLYT